MHSFTMSFDQAVLVHQLVSNQCQSTKNWIASAVESGDLERAQKLVVELREYEKLYAGFNVKAKQEIALAKKEIMPDNHTIRG